MPISQIRDNEIEGQKIQKVAGSLEILTSEEVSFHKAVEKMNLYALLCFTFQLKFCFNMMSLI